MTPTTPDRRPLFQTIAIVASCIGLFCACGLGPAPNPPPHPPPLTLSLSATSITFPDTAIGSSSSPRQLTITNAEATPLDFSVVLQRGSRTQVLVESSSCHTSLPPDQSCTVTIVYKPSAVGHFTGLLYLFSPGRGIVRVPLEGKGTPAIP